VLTGDDGILGARAAPPPAWDAAPAEISPTRAAPDEASPAGLKGPALGRPPQLPQRRRASHELRHRRGVAHPAP
jgi:hypothetical protein